MREQQPMTQTMKISEVRGQLDTLVNRVFRKETRVLVKKSGIPVAAIVSTEDLARLNQLDQERAARFGEIDEVRSASRSSSSSGTPAPRLDYGDACLSGSGPPREPPYSRASSSQRKIQTVTTAPASTTSSPRALTLSDSAWHQTLSRAFS